MASGCKPQDRQLKPKTNYEKKKKHRMYRKGHKYAHQKQEQEVGLKLQPRASSPLKDIESIKKRVRAGNGLCYEKSIMLINELKEIGDNAVLMGLIGVDGLPFHFFVKSWRYGIIDIYPEGNPTGKLENGKELSKRWTPPQLMKRTVRIVNIELYRFKGAVLDNDIEKCKNIYKNLVTIVEDSQEKMRLQDEILQHLTIAILALKRGHKKIAYDTIERTKENFKYWSPLTIEEVKKRAEEGVGVCYEKAMYLLKGVRLLDPEAKFMAVMDKDNLPFHYYVYSPVYGNLDGFPPGNPSGILNGVPIEENWTKVIYMDVCNRIIRLECERAIKYLKEGKDYDRIFVYLTMVSAKDPERWRYRELMHELDKALKSPNPIEAIKQVEKDLTIEVKETDYKGPIYDGFYKEDK